MLIGHNGSGKSTLLRCLATALRPHHGRMLLAGEDIWRYRFRIRPDIAYLGHAHHVYGDLSGRENLAVWARLGGQKADASALLARVGLDPARHDPVRTYSAGMRRRLALARMLLKKPRLVLMDEPFSALDPEGRQLIIDIALELREGGATLVLASHVPAMAALCCSHVGVLDQGRLAPLVTVEEHMAQVSA